MGNTERFVCQSVNYRLGEEAQKEDYLTSKKDERLNLTVRSG